MTNGESSIADGLLMAARGGDASALGSLFSRHQNYIRLLAVTQLGSNLRIRASASDIVQDTFLHAHRGFADFRGTTTAEFSGWLRAILIRRIQYLYQQHVRAKRRDVRREVSMESIRRGVDQSTVRLENVLVDREPSPDSKVHHAERSLVVADALAQLPEDYQQILMMRSIEGLPFPQIAAKMDRSHGAVRMLWLRGIRKLKEHLEYERSEYSGQG